MTQLRQKRRKNLHTIVKGHSLILFHHLRPHLRAGRVVLVDVVEGVVVRVVEVLEGIGGKKRGRGMLLRLESLVVLG